MFTYRYSLYMIHTVQVPAQSCLRWLLWIFYRTLFSLLCPVNKTKQRFYSVIVLICYRPEYPFSIGNRCLCVSSVLLTDNTTFIKGVLGNSALSALSSVNYRWVRSVALFQTPTIRIEMALRTEIKDKQGELLMINEQKLKLEHCKKKWSW